MLFIVACALSGGLVSSCPRSLAFRRRLSAPRSLVSANPRRSSASVSDVLREPSASSNALRYSAVFADARAGTRRSFPVQPQANLVPPVGIAFVMVTKNCLDYLLRLLFVSSFFSVDCQIHVCTVGRGRRVGYQTWTKELAATTITTASGLHPADHQCGEWIAINALRQSEKAQISKWTLLPAGLLSNWL